MKTGSGIMPLNSPGGSTLQRGAGRGFVCFESCESLVLNFGRFNSALTTVFRVESTTANRTSFQSDCFGVDILLN